MSLESAASEVGIEIVASLAQHRILSAAQVPLARHRAGRADRAQGRRPRRRAAPDRPRGRRRHLQAHTLAVNDTAICFLEAARERGDEFGPFAWRHEVSHALSRGRGRRRRALVADAVLTYLRVEGEGVAIEQRFLEIDRATLTVDRLASELARYAELFRLAGGDGEPLWCSRYPVFPPVHCVLTGGSRAVLERRRSTTIALLRSDPRLARAPEVSISICLLEDLLAEGPFAPIFRDVREPGQPIDWLGG